MLELFHGEPNMFSLKPLIALHEKGLEFASHYVDFAALEPSPHRSTTEVRHDPEGEGPVLVDQGQPMTESSFIGLYLDEAYPAIPLRGVQPENHWQVLMWARFLNEVAAPAISTLGCHRYLAPALKKRSREDTERAIAKMSSKEQQDGWRAALDDSYTEELLAESRRKAELAVKKIEMALAQGAWLAGPSYSLADIDAFALLRPLARMLPDLVHAAPNTAAWLDRIEIRPAVRKALAASKTGEPETSFTPGPEHSRWG